MELKRYVEEYGISANEACEALAMKWSGYRNTEYQKSVLNSVEPPPKFALDALEADIFTSLLTRARPKTVAKYMKELGYDEHFRRAWLYYLSYCEAGFEEGYTGDIHLLLAKPECKLCRGFPQ